MDSAGKTKSALLTNSKLNLLQGIYWFGVNLHQYAAKKPRSILCFVVDLYLHLVKFVIQFYFGPKRSRGQVSHD